MITVEQVLLFFVPVFFDHHPLPAVLVYDVLDDELVELADFPEDIENFLLRLVGDKVLAQELLLLDLSLF